MVHLPSVDIFCMVINLVCWVLSWLIVFILVVVDPTFMVVADEVEYFLYKVDFWEDVNENIGVVLKLVICNGFTDTVIFPVISSVVILLVVFESFTGSSYVISFIVVGFWEECIEEDIASDLKVVDVVILMDVEDSEEDVIAVCWVDWIIVDIDASVANDVVGYLFVDFATVVFPLVTVTRTVEVGFTSLVVISKRNQFLKETEEFKISLTFWISILYFQINICFNNIIDWEIVTFSRCFTVTGQSSLLWVFDIINGCQNWWTL